VKDFNPSAAAAAAAAALYTLLSACVAGHFLIGPTLLYGFFLSIHLATQHPFILPHETLDRICFSNFILFLFCVCRFQK
jgi:hypothetical protein